MPGKFDRFSSLARTLAGIPVEEFQQVAAGEEQALHPFDLRNIDSSLPSKVKALFDDGHYAEATFAAFKYLESYVRKHSSLTTSGFNLMMAAFDEQQPKLRLTPLQTESDKDEQKGFRFLFAGGVQAIRNPRAHEYALVDDPDICLDHLTFVSMLLRKLKSSGIQ